MTTGPVGKQSQLLLLDTVLSFPSQAIDLIVKLLRLARKVGNEKSRIGPLGKMLGLNDNATLFIPGGGGITEFPEQTLFLAGLSKLPGGRIHPGTGQLLQHTIADYADDITDIMLITPSHQSPATQPTIPTKYNLDVRPLPAKPLHQQLQNRPAVQGRIYIGRTKVGNQQLTTTEHVQWQEAVMVVIAVKESLLLIAMYKIIGRVKVQHQPIRRCGMRSDECLDKHLGNSGQCLTVHAVFQAAQGRRRSQRQVFFDTAFRKYLEQRVFPKALMIVKVFIAQGDAQDTLGQHGSLGMNGIEGVAWVRETVIDRIDQTEPLVGLSQQQCPGIRGDASPIEIALNFLASEA